MNLGLALGLVLGVAPVDWSVLILHPAEQGVRCLHLISGFGFQISGLGLRVPGFGLRVPGFGLRVSDFGFRVSGFKF